MAFIFFDSQALKSLKRPGKAFMEWIKRKLGYLPVEPEKKVKFEEIQKGKDEGFVHVHIPAVKCFETGVEKQYAKTDSKSGSQPKENNVDPVGLAAIPQLAPHPQPQQQSIRPKKLKLQPTPKQLPPKQAKKPQKSPNPHVIQQPK